MTSVGDVACGAVSAAIQPNNYWWVAPVATLFAAFAASVFAFFQIRTNRQMARLRASLDLIERTESQEFYQTVIRTVKEVVKRKFEYMSLDDRRAIAYLLNHYEIIAIGCRNDVLDKKFYKEWMRSAYINDWHTFEQFIHEIRYPTDGPAKPTLYIAFERLAKEWEREQPVATNHSQSSP